MRRGKRRDENRKIITGIKSYKGTKKERKEKADKR